MGPPVSLPSARPVPESGSGLPSGAGTDESCLESELFSSRFTSFSVSELVASFCRSCNSLSPSAGRCLSVILSASLNNLIQHHHCECHDDSGIHTRNKIVRHDSPAGFQRFEPPGRIGFDDIE